MKTNLKTKSHIFVDLRVYRLEAIKKCVYRLSGVWQIDVQIKNKETVEICYEILSGLSTKESFTQIFWPELIDQEMRCVVQDETKALKNLILAQAYAPVSLLDDTCKDMNL